MSSSDTRILPPLPPGWTAWEDVMRVALDNARLAAAAGEVPVGAVVIGSNGDILGQGYNSMVALSDPTAHAEVLALRQAAEAVGNYRLNGAVLTVTLEPCLMCAGALVQARVAGVVYGAADPKAGALASFPGQLTALELPLHNHIPWQLDGILYSECAALLHEFFLTRR